MNLLEDRIVRVRAWRLCSLDQLRLEPWLLRIQSINFASRSSGGSGSLFVIGIVVRLIEWQGHIIVVGLVVDRTRCTLHTPHNGHIHIPHRLTNHACFIMPPIDLTFVLPKPKWSDFVTSRSPQGCSAGIRNIGACGGFITVVFYDMEDFTSYR